MKKEKRQQDLSQLENNFFIKSGQYLQRKKNSAPEREYKNAKRVLDKIIEYRRSKIVKNAKIAVKSSVRTSDLNLLPREQQLFLEVKEIFQEYIEEIDEVLDQEITEIPDIEQEEPVKEEENEEDVEEIKEGYDKVKIVSDVPEFMGTDLESYGPFDEGEKVEIPEDNAEILVNRGNAEKIKVD